MKTRVVTMREKIIASAASAALVASMVVCAPSVAFATIDESLSSIAATCDEIYVVMGSQTNMSNYFNPDPQGGDQVSHVDYKITSGDDIASINKHTGMLTATSTGQVVVTAYLTGIATPTGNKNNPCVTTSVSDTITVNITSTSTYGYQGVGNTIKMTSPSVESFSGNNTTGWTNILEASSPASDDCYYFTIEMTNGFKDYNTALSFAGINAGNIYVQNANGTSTTSLAANNQSDVFIESVNNTTKTVEVGVDKSLVTAAGTKLVFASGFRGNSPSNTLGTTITFVIN